MSDRGGHIIFILGGKPYVKIPRALLETDPTCARSTRVYKQRSATPRKWNPSPTRRSRPPKRRPSARLPTSSRRARRKSTRWVARAAFNRSQILSAPSASCARSGSSETPRTSPKIPDSPPLIRISSRVQYVRFGGNPTVNIELRKVRLALCPARNRTPTSSCSTLRCVEQTDCKIRDLYHAPDHLRHTNFTSGR